MAAVAKWRPWVGLWYADAWHDISADVYDRDDITIRRGKTDESSRPVPTSLSLTLKNRDGRYTPDNPMSPLFGLLGRNTPIQVGFDPLEEDFEDTSYNFSYLYGSAGAWTRSSTRAHTGTWSFRNPSISDGQSSSWRIVAPAGANTLSFWVWQSISNSSTFAAYTSEGLQWYDYGLREEWRLITIDLGPGTYVDLEYVRASSGGSNAVWVDDVRTIDARATAEIHNLEPGRSISFDPSRPNARGDAWCTVTAGGLLRRIGQASDPTDSPIYRAVMRSEVTPAQYWPMEDPEGVQGAASALGLDPMTPVTEVRYTLPDGSKLTPGGLPKFRNDGGVPGSGPLVGFVDGGTLRGLVPPIPAGAYAIDIVSRFKPGADDGGTTSAEVLSWRESGTYVAFTINVALDAVTVFHANAADAATLSFTGSVVAAINVYDGAPHHIRYVVAQDGPDYEADLYVDGFYYGTADNFSTPGSMAGTVGRPTMVEWNGGEDRGEYMPAAAGHLIVWPAATGLPDIATPAFGHPGERIIDRFLRLAAEEQWAAVYRNYLYVGDTMGPQTVAPLADLLADIERTGDGILHDQRGSTGLVLRGRTSQYAQDSRLDLTYGRDALQPLTPVYDDQALRNHVTAKNRDSQQFDAVVTSGALAVTSPLDGGVGRYPATVDVNTDGGVTQLRQIAWWWANKGTVEGARHPRIVVDLDADPLLEASAAPIDMGDRIRVYDLEYDVVDLRVLGVSERLGHTRRTLTFLC